MNETIFALLQEALHTAGTEEAILKVLDAILPELVALAEKQGAPVAVGEAVALALQWFKALRAGDSPSEEKALAKSADATADLLEDLKFGPSNP